MHTYSARPSFQTVVQMAQEDATQQVWPMVTGDVDPSNLLSRDLFTYALILCEGGQHLERVPMLLERVQKMQNVNAESDTYGNFWWSWGQGAVLDPNAVEFSMRGGALLWLRHQDKLGDAKDILYDMLMLAVRACRHHASMPLYTNITLMNAVNMILLGQALDQDDLVKMGDRRFEQFCLYTWNWGIHEFCSPTYTPIQVACLGMMERFASDAAMRNQAGVMLQLFWANVATNWLDKAQYLGGTYSRNSGVFLDGDVNVIELLWCYGLLPLSPGSMQPLIKPTLNVIYQGLADWDAKKVFQQVSDAPYPHCLTQRWGPLQNQTRTFFQFEQVALSTTGAQYDYPNWQDVTLAANFNVPVLMDGNSKPTIYTPGKLIFIPDARAKGTLAKYSHYSPRLWTAAQDKQDAIGLVLFNIEDLDAISGVELNLLMSSWPGEIWVGDTLLAPSDAHTIFVEDTPVVFRHHGVAIGVRVVWQNGGAVPKLLQGTDDEHEAWVLSVDMTLLRETLNDEDVHAPDFLGTVFWTRIGEGLEEDAVFKKWRTDFALAQADVSIDMNAVCDITVAAAGEAGDLQIRAMSPDLKTFEVLLEPQESFALFNFNGRDYGFDILREMPLARKYQQLLNNLPQVDVPGFLNGDQGYVQFPMSKGYNIPNTPYLWVSPDNGDENGGSDTGCMTWHLSVPAGGRYYIWAEVWPTPSDDIVQEMGKGNLPLPKVDRGTNEMLVRVYQDVAHPLVLGTSLISCTDTSAWQWVPISVHSPAPPQKPMVIALPKGDVFLQLFSQTTGLKIRQLYVSDVLDDKPV